jgi:VWFA-related protein
MNKLNGIILVLFGACMSTPMARAQAQPNASDSATVIRATTRLVQVDVVVTDSAGHPVKDLSEKDFSILEDGKPQKVAVLSFRQLGPQKDRPQPPLLPPHVVTNRPEYQHTEGPVVVLLLDGINTAVENQMYVRQQILKFMAEHFNSNMRVAVVLLGNQLTVLQDFTSDPALLVAALRNYHSQGSAAGRQGGSDVQLQTPSFAGASIPARGTGQLPTGEAESSRSVANLSSVLARFEKETAANTFEMRIAITMDALSAIARYLAGFPGRKNVIWFSASFPLNLSLVDPEDFDIYRSYADRIRATTNLLSDAHVAIYTVDARGLSGTSISDPSLSGRDANGRIKLTVNEQMNAASKEVFERFNKEDSLIKIAHETGGRTFLNTNDLDRAVLDALEDGSAYYVLGYYPSRKQWDGKFRTIQVKVARDGVAVRHRRGYYATDPENWRRSGAEEMKMALERASISSTGVLFYARAVPPPAAANVEVKVEFVVDAHTISFDTASENAHYCNLEFQVQAFAAPDGKLVKAEVQQAEAPLKPQTFARIEQNGLPMPVPIKLPPGQYMLRLGVRDNRTGLFGTTELPLTLDAPAGK